MKKKSDWSSHGFLRCVKLLREKVSDFSKYPFSIPAIHGLDVLDFHPKVTFLIGDNGSGKSTLTEAIAIAAGFNSEGGTKNFNFATRNSESELHSVIRLVRGIRREKDGFFLRAESFFNVATEVDGLHKIDPLLHAYGGISLHEQSHGESFLALAKNRFGLEGLYVLDEPEAALSPSRQLSFLAIMHNLVTKGNSQFIIATHSPILMAYPEALIYNLSLDGIVKVDYETTEHFQLTRDFLMHREKFFKHLFVD